MSETIVSLQQDSKQQLEELLRLRLSQIDEERERLAHQRSELDAKLNKIEEERRHIAALLGEDATSGPPRGTDGDTFPGNPADLVAKLLRETGPLHYREIERQLRARGWYRAGGADPANTLLAKYFQDARLYRPRRGVYAIRPEGATVQSVGTKRKGARRRRHGSGSAT